MDIKNFLLICLLKLKINECIIAQIYNVVYNKLDKIYNIVYNTYYTIYYMKTDTRQKIFEFIQKNSQVSPKQIIEFIGLGAPAVFRQLKKLQELDQIAKTGKPPKVFYHLPDNAETQMINDVFSWATKEQGALPESRIYCQTRDVFQARQDKLPKEINIALKDEQLSFLLSAVVGEIGNNSFDHNFGNWPDVPGIFFQVNAAERTIILADRGNGVFATLKKVRADIKNNLDALRVAFTEIVSGRSPEQRGNGLKFVRKVAESCEIKINFYSGNASCLIESGETKFTLSEKNIPGTVVIIQF